MLQKICLMVTISFLISCSDPFPADILYNIDQENKVCDVYKIDKDNIKFTFSHEIPFEKCPDTFGFESKDVPKVMSWIRRNKKKLSECK